MTDAKSEHYKAAGVDIDAADSLIDRIKPFASATRVPGATAGLGGFGGIFDLAAAGYPGAPRLVSGTDGVGTKLKVAFATGKHDTIGQDCVAMCVNDILAVGARPLFFLDYFATGRLEVEAAADVIKGIARGCELAKCWLAGGETAEMPGMYPDGEYDLAGFVVGAVTDESEILPQHATEGDVVVGIASAGIHSNGYSLARKVLLEDAALPLDAPLGEDDLTLGDRLLVPTMIYVEAMSALSDVGIKPTSVAHITGGGLWENPHRSIPKELAVSLEIDALRSMRQPIFEQISHLGGVPEREMYRVFNMGIGLTLSLSKHEANDAVKALSASGYDARPVGQLIRRQTSAVTIDGTSDAPIA